MLGGLVRFILFRVLGARALLAITVFGWLRKVLAGRRNPPRPLARSARSSGYQPSQGESQIVQREPR